MDLSSLGVPALTPLLLGVVAFTVWVIQLMKHVLTMHIKGKWTQKIPGWVWLALSIAIPIGIVYLLNLNWVNSWVSAVIPPTMGTAGLEGTGTLATGVITAIASNGSYAVIKKLGLAGDYTPGGPNDISGPLPDDVNDAEYVEESTTKPAESVVDTSQNGSQHSQNGTVSNAGNTPEVVQEQTNAVVSHQGIAIMKPVEVLHGTYYALSPDGRLWRVENGVPAWLPQGYHS